MQDILDIEPIVKLGWNPNWIWQGLLLLLALILLGYLIYRIVQRRKNSIRIRPPHERALATLARLNPQTFQNGDGLKRYYFAISEVFRRYLVERFNYPALDKTTEEMFIDLHEKVKVKKEEATAILQFFTNADKVKFGGLEGMESVAASDKVWIEKFIQRMR